MELDRSIQAYRQFCGADLTAILAQVEASLRGVKAEQLGARGLRIHTRCRRPSETIAGAAECRHSRRWHPGLSSENIEPGETVEYVSPALVGYVPHRVFTTAPPPRDCAHRARASIRASDPGDQASRRFRCRSVRPSLSVHGTIARMKARSISRPRGRPRGLAVACEADYPNQ